MLRPIAVLLATLPLAACGTAPRRAAVAPVVLSWQDEVEPSRILLLQSTQLDRTAEVIGPIDVREPIGGEQAALALLRQRAAAVRADAVVGVEFHHGDGGGEPSHLSGLAVRFVAPVRGSLP